MYLQPLQTVTVNVGSVLGSEDEKLEQKATGELIVSPIGSKNVPFSQRENGVIDIHEACFHDRIVGGYLHRHTGDSELLSAPASAGDTSITVVDGSTFTAGDRISIVEGATEERFFFTVKNVLVNVLTLDAPLTNAFTVLAVVEIVQINVAQNGSLVSPISFKLTVPTGEIWHITKFVIAMIDATEGDDSKFAGATALANGLVIREVHAGVIRNISIWKKNQDVLEDVGDFGYSDKAGVGKYGMHGSWNYKQDSDSIIKLNGTTGDYLEVLVQDNLTDVDDIQIKACGHAEVA